MKNLHFISADHKTVARERITHAGGVDVGDEIAFFTPFDYMFPRLARDPASRIVENHKTIDVLIELGQEMFEPTPAEPAYFDSETEAVFTYLGQFIDHDLTARTDRDTALSDLDPPDLICRRDPDRIIVELKNGRRPNFDLDSVYADGPLMVDTADQHGDTAGDRFGLFDSKLRMNVVDIAPNRIDIPRRDDGLSLIADGRNDENLNISQLHAAFLAFHNKVADGLPKALSARSRFVRARQLTRWAYQYLVVNEYLPKVCAPAVVEDTIANGPRFFGHPAGRGDIFMPLEFSVAGFRFGHTMIRPEYQLNDTQNRAIDKLLFPGRVNRFGNGADLLDPSTRVLNREFAIDWNRFVPDGTDPQMARVFDVNLAQGLKNLIFEDTNVDALKMLPARNLLRGFSLSLPTGQAVAQAMGITPIDLNRFGPEHNPKVNAVLEHNDLRNRTPLWFYVLHESRVHTQGKTLGAVGSRLVCETIIGLLASSSNSYLNNRHDPAVTEKGVKVTSSNTIANISDFLRFAGVF